MTQISRRHPRYRSLRLRSKLADAAQRGLVVPEGFIAQGRGEAFDYLVGERTSASARRATRAAAVWLANARRPVISVNGNVAALAADRVARLAKVLPSLGVEVNLFHRTPARARLVARTLKEAGVREVLGVRPIVRLAGLSSDRARIDARGIARADVCLVPLEDGDRAAALRAAGKRVIAIDLNPLSRTAQTADLPIVDELSRVLDHLVADVPAARTHRSVGRFPPFDARRALREAFLQIERGLRRARRSPRPSRASKRPHRAVGGRSRRTRAPSTR
jgi:4-phosphopantoate--beta-alanine ligase